MRKERRRERRLGLCSGGEEKRRTTGRFGDRMLAGMQMQPAGKDAAAPEGCRDGDGVTALILHAPTRTSTEVR